MTMLPRVVRPLPEMRAHLKFAGWRQEGFMLRGLITLNASW